MSLAHPAAPTLARHPNEMDLRRITRALSKRARYRYVTPAVEAVADGYLVRSPCCSRGPDPAGGVIDIALIAWRASPPAWHLLRRDHRAQAWVEDSAFARISDLLARLNADPQRNFWQ